MGYRIPIGDAKRDKLIGRQHGRYGQQQRRKSNLEAAHNRLRVVGRFCAWFSDELTKASEESMVGKQWKEYIENDQDNEDARQKYKCFFAGVIQARWLFVLARNVLQGSWKGWTSLPVDL